MRSLYGKLLSPQLLLLMLHLIHLSLHKQLLATIFISTISPIPPRLNLMTKHMRLKSIFNMRIVAPFIVLYQCTEITTDEDDELVPFLVDQSFDKYKIFGYLVGQSLS